METLSNVAAPKHPHPETLEQQQQRRYIHALMDVTVQTIASIWRSPTPGVMTETTTRPLASLNTFLHHILKHSRTTHSTLQLAVFYLLRVRESIRQHVCDDAYVKCGRRMFLASLICSHKYLQDKSFKNATWSKLSGLDVHEVNHAERVMLQLLDYKLHVQKETYHQWVVLLQNHLKLKPVGVWERNEDAHTLKQLCKIPTTATHASDTTVLAFGMPTPVETSLSLAHPNLGLLSPPDHGTHHAKRKLPPMLANGMAKKRAF